MFKTLLFPTDFSPAADHAFAYVIQFAKQLNAEIVVMHAFHYSQTEAKLAPVDVLEGLHSKRRESAIRQLEDYKAMAQKQGYQHLKINAVVKDGFAENMIRDACAQIQPDLVIMGCQGHSSLSERLMGSVSLAIMREASQPVLAIPAKAEFRGIHNIAYATDFEEEDGKLREELLALGHSLKARVCAVNVSNHSKTGEASHTQITDWSGERVPIHFLRGKEVEQSLLQFIAEEKINLLAVLPHERSFLEGLFHKNLTTSLARHLDIPLLAFHARDRVSTDKPSA